MRALGADKMTVFDGLQASTGDDSTWLNNPFGRCWRQR